MSDLGDILARAGAELGAQADPLDDGALSRVLASARRRRVRRHAYQAAAAAAAVAVAATGGWWGVQHQEPAPAQTPSPLVSTPVPERPTPTPAPTPSATPDGDGPVVREASIDDETVLRRLVQPRTGETWHAPEPADDLDLLTLDEHSAPGYRTVRVGARGSATIYAVAGPMEPYSGERDVVGLFEVDAAGPRYIACPGPQSQECGGPGDVPALPLAPGVTVDLDTFYDTLGIPTEADLVDGFAVRTTAGTWWDARPQRIDEEPALPVLGDARTLFPAERDDEYRPDDVTDLTTYGPAALVELRWSAELVAGLTNVSYAWRTPYGALVHLGPGDVPGSAWDEIVWDDGVDRRLTPSDPESYALLPPETRAPGDHACVSSRFSLEEDHVDAQWRPAGRTRDGTRVYVPVAGGNDVASRVRAWQASIAWTVDLNVGPDADDVVQGPEVYAADTGYGTDEAFLAANALFALERPDGRWMLGLRPDALAPVYECV